MSPEPHTQVVCSTNKDDEFQNLKKLKRKIRQIRRFLRLAGKLYN